MENKKDKPKPSLCLKAKRLGIDTYKEAIIYLQKDSPICSSEGLQALRRIGITVNHKEFIATLQVITSDLLKQDELGFSEYAWMLMDVHEGDRVHLSHPKPLESLSYIHDKIYNRKLSSKGIKTIIDDVVSGRLSDVQIASFLTACAAGRLDKKELISLTQSMVMSGQTLSWNKKMIVDKHCIGGLPGNRTTPIIVSIVAAYGLMIPKTSSRAITSAAGTADVMETLAPVELTLSKMREVVEKENGCVVWGGLVNISPADDILIRVEDVLNIDSEGQAVASVLSKKISAGSNHILIDVPVGPTAKVRNEKESAVIKNHFEAVGKALNINVQVILSDGIQPVGYGIGPALEAMDILAVLNHDNNAPQDLREKSLILSGKILEFSDAVKEGEGYYLAKEILDSKKAHRKFEAICEAQGGMREPPKAKYQYDYCAEKNGVVKGFDNYHIAKIAKLAGAPSRKEAGVKLHVKLNHCVSKDQPLFTIHAQNKVELQYAVNYLKQDNHLVGLRIED